MKRFSVKLLVACFMLGWFSGLAEAGWSLLEDFQMQDVAGEKGVCLSPLKQECAFDSEQYGLNYSKEVLLDDMDAARDNSIEMIYDIILPNRYVPPPFMIMTINQPPTLGEPFFQSGWYSSDLSGWESLID